MGRLTIPDVRVDERTTRRSVIDVAAVREHAMEFYCRLKAYEDTGFEPEEVTALGKLFDYALKESKTLTEQLTLLKHIRELAEADKDGRCVVLPCKPGDTVYSIFGAEVIEKTVGRVIINGYTTPRIWVDLDCPFLSSVTKRWDLGIGKDFFLTREEAKKVLEERKGKKDG